MVFLTKKMENVMTMYDERIAELEHLLLTAENKLAESERKVASLQDANAVTRARAFDETSMMGGIIYFLLNECGLEQHHLEQAIKESSWTDTEVKDVLEYHEAVPEGWLSRDYYVTASVPVTVCMTITARDAEHAEEIARDLLESEGLEMYDMEYNTYYDAEYSVEEA